MHPAGCVSPVRALYGATRRLAEACLRTNHAKRLAGAAVWGKVRA